MAALDAMTMCSFSSYAFSLEDYAAALGLVTTRRGAPRPCSRPARESSISSGSAMPRWGIGAASDTLPERFLEEPVPNGRHAGKVCDLEPMLQAYYALRGWPGGELPPERRLGPDTIAAIL